MSGSGRLVSFVLVIIATAASPALAGPTRVALTIHGGEKGLRKAVVGALGETDLEVVSAKRTDRAIEKLGLDEISSPKEAKKLGAALKVKTVVAGALDDDTDELRFTVFTNGKMGTSFALKATDVHSAKFKKTVRSKMLEKLGVTDPRSSDDEQADADEDAKPVAKEDRKGKKAKSEDEQTAKDEDHKGKKAKDESDEKAAKDEDHKGKKAKSHADDEEETADHEEGKTKDSADDKHRGKRVAAADDVDDEDPDETTVRASTTTTSKPVRGANLAMVRVDIGPSITARTLRFTSESFDAAPASYKSKPVAGARVAAELYPQAGQGLIGGIGIAGDFDQTRGLTVGAMDTTFAVKERHYSVGLRYRLAFGHRPTSPTITAGVGYGARTFKIEGGGSAVADLPNVDYRMIDPSLAVRVPIGARIAVTAEGRALLLRSAGAITEPDQYGRAHVLGGSAAAGLEVQLARYVALRLDGEATQLDMKFYGDGAQATSRDGDSTTIDVHSARDRYVGGAATLAILY